MTTLRVTRPHARTKTAGLAAGGQEPGVAGVRPKLLADRSSQISRRAPVLWFVWAAVAVDLNLGFTSRLGAVGSNIGNVLWLGVAGALALRSLGGDGRAGFRAVLQIQDAAFLGWLGLMTTSMLWSLSANESLKEVVPLAVIWFATLFLCTVPVVDAVRAVVAVAVVCAVLSLVLLMVAGEVAHQPSSSTGAPELRGIFEHQLRLGALMAVAIGLIVVATLRGDLARVAGRSTSVRIAIVALLLVVLVLSRARLYVVEAGFALALTLALSQRRQRPWLLPLVGVLTALAVSGRFGSAESELQDSNFDTSLTGRTEVWERTLSGVTDSSRWIGHGFGTFKLPEFDALFQWTYRPAHAHSSYVQAYFETGTVGLAALVLLVLVQLAVAWRHSVRCTTYSYSLFLVLYTALGSLTGLNYAGRSSALFSLAMLFLAIESRLGPDAARHRTGTVGALQRPPFMSGMSIP